MQIISQNRSLERSD